MNPIGIQLLVRPLPEISLSSLAILQDVQKGSSSKAAGDWASGAYAKYVSTTKRRERRWRPFSTSCQSAENAASDLFQHPASGHARAHEYAHAQVLALSLLAHSEL